MRDVIIFNKVKRLSLVNVSAIAIGMDNLIRIAGKVRADIARHFVIANCGSGLAGVFCKRVFLFHQAGFNLFFD